MLMHKPLEKFYNYLVGIADRKINKIDTKRKEREEKFARTYWVTESYDYYLEEMHKKSGLPPLDAKNPYRFA